jgi:hypothetical protein
VPACLPALSPLQKLPFSATLCLRFLWQDTSKLCMPASLPCPRCTSYHFLLYCVSGFSGRTQANYACLPPFPVPGAKVTIFCFTVSQVSLAGYQKTVVDACLPALSPVQKLPFSATPCLRFLWQDTSKLCMPASLPCPRCKSYHCLLYCVSGFSFSGRTPLTMHACLPALSPVQKLPFSAILCLRFLGQDIPYLESGHNFSPLLLRKMERVKNFAGINSIRACSEKLY